MYKHSVCINQCFMNEEKAGVGVPIEKQKISSPAWTYLIPCQGEDHKAHFQGFNSSLESPLPLSPL